MELPSHHEFLQPRKPFHRLHFLCIVPRNANNIVGKMTDWKGHLGFKFTHGKPAQ